MKTDVAPLHYLTKGFHLDEDSIHTKTWCCNNIDCNFEHAMHKSVDSYPQPLRGWEIRGSLTCSFEILLAFDMEFGMAYVDHEDC